MTTPSQIETPESLDCITRIKDEFPISERQIQIATILKSYSDENRKFDQWYLSALMTLNTKVPDKYAQAAHSIREISDQFPRQLGIPFFKSPISPTKNALSDLFVLKDQEYEAGWSGQAIIPKLARILDQFTGLRTYFDAPPRTAGFRIALEKRDPLGGHLDGELRRRRDQEFSDCYDYFQNVAHHNIIPSPEKFLDQLSKYENLILSYLSPVTASQQQELLSLIRTSPTESTKERLIELITHNASNYALLLDRLENEAWLPLLRDLNIFSEFPEPELLEGGGLCYRNYIPLSCLARLTPKSPSLTVEIIEGLPSTTNPQILDQIIRCISQISEESLIPRCSKAVEKVLRSPTYEANLWLQQLVHNWVSMGYHEVAFRILRVFISKLIINHLPYVSSRSIWLLRELDEQCMPRLTELNPKKAYETMFYTLKEWADLERKNYKSPDFLESIFGEIVPDQANIPSTYWLEDFRAGPNYDTGLEGVLAMRLFSTGRAVFVSGEITEIAAFDKLLRRDPWKLFTHLRWELYSLHPKISLEFAKEDTLSFVETLGMIDGTLTMAQFRMIESLSENHGSSYLESADIDRVFSAVMAGPVDENGAVIEDEKYRDRFRKKQLQPFRRLLSETQRLALEAILVERPEPVDTDYRLISAGRGARRIQFTAPAEVENFANLTVQDILDFINRWDTQQRVRNAEKWWIEEDVDALAGAFVDHLENEPAKFTPDLRWWEQVQRPMFFSRILSRATARITGECKEGGAQISPDGSEWENWLGIIEWITFGDQTKGGEATVPDPVYWARLESVRFLGSLFETTFSVPSECIAKVPNLLIGLFEAADSKLGEFLKSWTADCHTDAINSVSGRALDALLSAAYHEIRENKNSGTLSLIKRSILNQLSSADTLPGIYSIIGSRLRLFLHIFEEDVRGNPDIVLCHNPACRNALIVSNARYDRSDMRTLDIIPTFADASLECLRLTNEKHQGEKEESSDFGYRIGINLAFYHWNSAYKDDTIGAAQLDEFFGFSTVSQRTTMIRNIGTMFRDLKPSPEVQVMILRVQAIWDRRFSKLVADLENKSVEPEDYRREVQGFLNWTACEAFDFDWRIDNAVEALTRIAGPLQYEDLLRDLEQIVTTKERLYPALRVLKEVTDKETRINHWAYWGEELKNLIAAGLTSDEGSTATLSKEIQETFLRLGHSYLLD